MYSDGKNDVINAVMRIQSRNTVIENKKSAITRFDNIEDEGYKFSSSSYLYFLSTKDINLLSIFHLLGCFNPNSL